MPQRAPQGSTAATVPIPLDARVRAAPELLCSDVGGEAVILNMESGIYFGLDPVGTRVWELLQAPRTPAEIRDELLAEFDVEPSRCEADVLRLLGGMRDEGLVIAADSAEGRAS